MRPFDPVNAVWTAEAWIKVGYPFPSSLASNRGGGEDYDEEGSASGEAGGRSGSSALRLRRDMVVMARTERFLRLRPTPAPTAASPAGSTAPASSALPQPSLPPGLGALTSPAVAPVLEAAARMQWSLCVRADGALAFNSLLFDPTSVPNGGTAFGETLASSGSSSSSGGGAASPAASASASLHSVASAPGAVPLGEWCHVAIVVDASAAAKEATARIKSAGAASDAAAARAGLPAVTAASLQQQQQQASAAGGGGAAGGGAATISPVARSPLVFDATPLPPATVRLFVDAAQVGEGKAVTALPLPLLDLPPAPGPTPATTGTAAAPSSASHPAFPSLPPQAASVLDGSRDCLLIGPDFIGRMAEVRLWAKRRTADELSDSKDFHLDSAESKRTKMSVVIRPATLPAGGTSFGGLGTPASSAGGAATPSSTGSGLAAPKLGGLAAPSGLGAAAATKRRMLSSAQAGGAAGEGGAPGASTPASQAAGPVTPGSEASAAFSAGGGEGAGTLAAHGDDRPGLDDDEEEAGAVGIRLGGRSGLGSSSGIRPPSGLGSSSGLRPPLGGGGLGAPPPPAGGASKKAAMARLGQGQASASGPTGPGSVSGAADAPPPS